MSLAEVLRETTVRDMLSMTTVSACWPTWQQAIRSSAGHTPTSATLLRKLGPDLANVFRQTSSGRTQSSQSAAGSAWEAMVCWYLNLCLIGTRTVVIKKASHWPEPVRDALTVTYGTVKTNTESDLVAVTFPANAELDHFSGRYTGRVRQQLDAHIATLLGQIEVCVIQCKTNWNENAQIPMMWDMIYSATGFNASHASIGMNGHSVRALKRFAYAFVTLPSNRLSGFTNTAMPVLRCRNLSGGNYWGLPGKNGVAGAIPDIFARNFASSTQTLSVPWPNHLDNEIVKLFTTYSYFNY